MKSISHVPLATFEIEVFLATASHTNTRVLVPHLRNVSGIPVNSAVWCLAEKELIKGESMQQKDKERNAGEGENEDSAGEGDPGSGHSVSSNKGMTIGIVN